MMNHHTAPIPTSARPGAEVQEYHRRLPGYAPTPLRDMPAIASALGVGRVLVKDESTRLGLPAFKVLGASWAVYRVLCARLGGEPPWSTLDELAAIVRRELGELRFVAATDGNHGRAVAHVARLLGQPSTILVPVGTAAARIEAIESEGAELRVVDGTYDDAIAKSAAMAADDVLVVSDTSWPGYENTPRWVIEGYSTIFAELDSHVDAIDVAFVPAGVGALAAAAAVALRAGREPGDGPMLVGVEPDTAACVAAAVEAGHVVEVPGPHRSIMAGLNCGLASVLALPTIIDGYAAMVSVDDDRCRAAIRMLADEGMDVGETGAASLAGLTAVLDLHADELPIPPTATVLLLATEGVTDPVGFENAVGRPPRN